MPDARRIERMTPPRTRRFGKRAFGMLACSYIWVLLGVGNYRQIPTDRSNVVHLTFESDVRGLMWLLPVAVALLTCFSRRWSWVGIMFLFAPAVLTMVSYAQSWVVYKLPNGMAGYSDGWYQSAIYLGACLIPVLVALFPSPPVIEVNTALLDGRKKR